MNALGQKLQAMGSKKPSFHVVLGSGFKDAVHSGGLPSGFQILGQFRFRDLPGLASSTAPGHAGQFAVIRHSSGIEGLLQVGRLHGYEGLDPRAVVNPLWMSRECGVDQYFLTNAAGGISPSFEPGDAVILTDQINLTGKSPLLGEIPKRSNGEDWGPRFPDLTNLFDRAMSQKLAVQLKAESLKVHEGVYVGVLGPAFETPAEIRFFGQVGAHVVGMSTVWETIAMKHTGAKVVGVSLVSNKGAGLNGTEELDHFAILDACRSSSVGILKGILNAVL
jgi:purine-nucleoside phosphorylase